MIQTISQFCEEAGLPFSTVNELCEAFQRKELVELARHEARMLRRNAGTESLPLRDEGDDFGIHEARIPKTLFFNLLQRENFGWEGIVSDEGMRDLLRDNPQCRVKTVTGKIVSGYRGPGRTVVKRYSERSGLKKSEARNPKSE